MLFRAIWALGKWLIALGFASCNYVPHAVIHSKACNYLHITYYIMPSSLVASGRFSFMKYRSSHVACATCGI